MRKRSLVLAGAVAAVLALTSGTASASNTSSAASIEGCSTWQYRVTQHAWVRDLPPPTGRDIADAYAGDIANIKHWTNNNAWFGGNFYTPGGTHYASGWILAAKLNYIRCW